MPVGGEEEEGVGGGGGSGGVRRRRRPCRSHGAGDGGVSGEANSDKAPEKDDLGYQTQPPSGEGTLNGGDPRDERDDRGLLGIRG